jgi:MerR family transcriptional regulator, thiopeptide resistance regulator
MDTYAEEARERWGDTTQYAQSQERTARYTEEDWQEIKAAAADLERRFAEALRDGARPDSERAMALAEEHRRQIDGRFFDCDQTMHRALGDMYVADARFTAHYDAQAPGLARYVRDAIHANADRAAA